GPVRPRPRAARPDRPMVGVGARGWGAVRDGTRRGVDARLRARGIGDPPLERRRRLARPFSERSTGPWRRRIAQRTGGADSRADTRCAVAWRTIITPVATTSSGPTTSRLQ